MPLENTPYKGATLEITLKVTPIVKESTKNANRPKTTMQR